MFIPKRTVKASYCFEKSKEESDTSLLFKILSKKNASGVSGGR